MPELTLALAQMSAGPDPAENLLKAREYAGRASKAGARLLLFPEMFMALPQAGEPLSKVAEPLDGPFASALAGLGREFQIYIAGCVWEKVPGSQKVFNVACLFDPEGKIVAHYRKLHLFDALNVRESDLMLPGAAPPPVVSAAGFNVGFAICYDLRFPEVFRCMAEKGVELILVPAAWYAGPLKEEQWLTLLRARAMENVCYAAGAVLAGPPFSGRSAAFDPYGVVLVDSGEGEGLLLARLDSARIAQVRSKLPALSHRRSDIFKPA